METYIYRSPLGILLLAADKEGLCRLDFVPDGKNGERITQRSETENPFLAAASEWLDRYFSGERMETPVSLLNPQGTEFQMRVFRELMKIPYGTGVTYGELAARDSVRGGKEKMSAQAVGQAVHSNPIAILIPCHRVLGAGGTLTGYGGGIARKILLLETEKIPYQKNQARRGYP